MLHEGGIPIFWHFADWKSNFSKKWSPNKKTVMDITIWAIVKFHKGPYKLMSDSFKETNWQDLHQSLTNSLQRIQKEKTSQLDLWGQHNLDIKHWQKHDEK